VSQLHDLQPIILDPAVYDAWLDPQRPAEDVKGLLDQRLNSACQFARVSRDVNAAAVNKQPNDKASMIEPINPSFARALPGTPEAHDNASWRMRPASQALTVHN
jgi:putative SOS response-associated peptidase YedK